VNVTVLAVYSKCAECLPGDYRNSCISVTDKYRIFQLHPVLAFQYKKLSDRRETARQLPTWKGGR